MSVSPATPLELQSALPNRVLVNGLCKALSHTPFGLACGTILLCALKPSAAHAFTSHSLSVAGPFSRRFTGPI
ncbi:MAG TPA: hypothetical protein VLG76_08880 [Rhabdochlamydiaceae bacterium]|nr:hypothetical protein [Rhabdochlamydiaceae bacterium]